MVGSFGMITCRDRVATITGRNTNRKTLIPTGGSVFDQEVLPRNSSIPMRLTRPVSISEYLYQRERRSPSPSGFRFGPAPTMTPTSHDILGIIEPTWALTPLGAPTGNLGR